MSKTCCRNKKQHWKLKFSPRSNSIVVDANSNDLEQLAKKKLKKLKEDNNAFQEYNIKELNEVKSIQDMKIKLID